MWGKIFLATTGLMSLLFFLSPEKFELFSAKDTDVLGIQKINAKINKSSVETALTLHCLDKNDLPKELNNLYGDYLDSKVKVDLEELFIYRILSSEDCEYSLQPI